MNSPIISHRAFVGVLLFFGHSELTCAQEPRHERATTAAWEAFKKEDYKEATRQADICIDEFFGAANRRQKELDETKDRIPNGRVNEKQKEAIFKNGTLNDVGTCHYIKARAAAKLGKKEDVAAALAAAAQYPAARAWDTKGWFWSPAEAAERFRTNPELADKSPHEVYTAEAWAAFNKGAHEKAMAHATKCVEEFHEAALEMEKDLAKRGVRTPTGAVDEATKKSTFENGLLNDVASCLFIKGKAAEAKGDKKTAVAAYTQALKLTHGRCWDPQGWFWSPAEGASDRLEILK